MLERRRSAWCALALACVLGAACNSVDAPRGGVELALPLFDGPRPEANSKTWPIVLVAPDGERIDLLAYGVGRGGYAVQELKANGFAREFNVLTPTWSIAGASLTFEYVPAEGEGNASWRVGLAEGRGDAFHVVAVSEHEAADWADWAVVSPDGSRVAAWVFEDEHAVHLMERRGDRLVVIDRRHAEAVKAFPHFASNGRLAVRLPLKGERLYYANAIDGVIGERLRAVREVQFDARGDRWAYAGRRDDGWYVFAGTGPTPAAENGPFDEVGEFAFDGVEVARARVREASGWRWIDLDAR